MEGKQPSASESGRTDPQGLATEFLARLERGELPDREEYASRLGSDDLRKEFRRLLSEELAEQDAARELKPGDELGRFVIVKEIGRGGMGQVYCALDPQLERHVALKVLPAQHARGARYLNRFKEECLILAQLHHPNIVAVHEAHSTPLANYLVMDLVEGRSAKEVLDLLGAQRTDRVSASDLEQAVGQPAEAGRENLIDPSSYYRSVVRILRKVLRALETAHDRGVLHRDLKPANVMLAGGGQPIVLDFGLAGWMDTEEGAVTQAFCGTMAYLAPEQVRNSRTGADPRTDVYQAGLLLYEFLTLRRTFTGDSLGELSQHILHGDFPWPRKEQSAVPRDLEAVCLKALEMDPARRYPSVAAMGADLDRYLEGSPTIARPPSLGRRALIFLRRHKVAAAAVLMLAGGLAAGLSFVRTAWPDDLRPFVLASGEPSPRVLGPRDQVRDGDVLGVEVKADRPLQVYALSIMGRVDGPPEFVNPVQPVPLSRLREDRVWEWQLEVPVSEEPQAVCFARISRGDAAAGGDWYEGVWLFTSEDRHDWVDDWMRALNNSPRDAQCDGVPIDRAMRLFETVTQPRRGGSLGDLPAAERAALLDSLQGLQVKEERIWRLEDPRMHEFYFSADFAE